MIKPDIITSSSPGPNGISFLPDGKTSDGKPMWRVCSGCSNVILGPAAIARLDKRVGEFWGNPPTTRDKRELGYDQFGRRQASLPQ